jgi:cell division protein FtsQ
MPLEMEDLDDEDSSRPGGRRFVAPSGPWWRPATTAGRVFLALGALTVLGGLTTSVVLAKSYLSRDSRFRIAGAGNIEATGLTQVSRAEMLPVFGEDIGRNVFFVPLGERRKQLEAIPWVQHATVMRLLPDHIRVSVVERQPVAFVRQGQQIGLVDAEGVLLTMPAATMAQHHYSFPVVTGISSRDPLPARKMRMAVYERLLGELDANNQHLSEQVSEIDLTDPQDARVLMPEQGTDILAHLGEDQFLDRYQRYQAHIAEWRQQYPKLVAVDLRYESQVVLEMTPGTNAVSQAVGGDSAGATDLSQTAAPAKPSAGIAKTDASMVLTAASKPELGSPAPGNPAPVNSKQSKPAFTTPASSAKPAKTTVSPPAIASANLATKNSAAQNAARPKTVSSVSSVSPETLAARQRRARQQAAKAKAARDKKEREKKRAAAQHAALSVDANGKKSSAPARTNPGQGQ